jgi:Xaa-Pro aminopeptidase
MSGVITRSDRTERLLGELDESGLDALLVTELTGVRYLTGYTGSNGLALVGPDRRLFVTDFRYVEQAAEEVDPGFERVRAPQDLLESVGELIGGQGRVRLGFDDVHTSVRDHARLAELVEERAELVPAGGLVERLRRVKEPAEVELISAATQVADEALEELLAGGLIGRTERELALSLEILMRERGAEGPAFETIIAAGGHGALPHAQPRDVAVQAGQMVVIDWGARMNGYCSDCTRTVATGRVEDEAREAYELVRHAQLTGLQAVRAGRNGREVDAEVREIIEEAGYGERYGHGLGHGVGLDIHEAPRLSQRSEDTLEAGNVVTVEPGVYLPGRFGVRIEDLVVVGEQGCLVLTGVGKDLRVVD